MTRRTATSRTLQAGCFTCHGSEARWTHAGAQGLAARHHDITGHPTWCDVALGVRYGAPTDDADQIDLEDAIAFASSGSAPEGAPLTDLDAPAVPAADVSVPVGCSSRHPLAAEKPETVSP